MRKSKDDTCSLADGVSAVVLTDESFANTHLTYKRTLMVRGDKAPPRYESVGERLCFADAYAVSNKGGGELSAKFVKGAFLKFRAQGTGKPRTGPTVQQLKEGLKLLEQKTIGKKSDLIARYIPARAARGKMTNDSDENSLLAIDDLCEDEFSQGMSDNVATLDYHGNFQHERYEPWFDKMCASVREEYGAGFVIIKDLVKYSNRCLNPHPNDNWKRDDVIKWIDDRCDAEGRDRILLIERKQPWSGKD